MKDLIDFSAALASGRFDPENLYKKGYPYLYSLDYSESEGRILLEAEGAMPIEGYSSSLRVGVAPEFYGTGETYTLIQEIDRILEKVFLREKFDLYILEKEFENAIFHPDSGNCPDLLKELIEDNINVVCGLDDSGNFQVVVNPREDDTPVGFVDFGYIKQDKTPEEQPAPLSLEHITHF